MSHVHYTATATATVPRFIRCEKCGHGYGYWLTRTGYGHASNYWGLIPIGREDRIVGDADVDVEQKLKLACEAVPCPECGWYQRHMLDRAREERYGWLLWAGIGAGILGAGLVTMALAMAEMIAQKYVRHGGGTLLMLLGPVKLSAFPLTAVLTVVGAYLLRNHLSARYDPNDEDVEVRRQRGWDRAMSPKEYARVAPKRKGKGTHQKLRPEDLE